MYLKIPQSLWVIVVIVVIVKLTVKDNQLQIIFNNAFPPVTSASNYLSHKLLWLFGGSRADYRQAHYSLCAVLAALAAASILEEVAMKSRACSLLLERGCNVILCHEGARNEPADGL